MLWKTLRLFQSQGRSETIWGPNNSVRLQIIAKRTLKCLNSAKSLDRSFCSLKCVKWQIMWCFSFRVIFTLFLEKASGLCVTSLFVTSSNKILTEISVTCPHQVSLNLWVGLCLCVCIDGAHRRSPVKSLCWVTKWVAPTHSEPTRPICLFH